MWSAFCIACDDNMARVDVPADSYVIIRFIVDQFRLWGHKLATLLLLAICYVLSAVRLHETNSYSY